MSMEGAGATEIIGAGTTLDGAGIGTAVGTVGGQGKTGSCGICSLFPLAVFPFLARVPFAFGFLAFAILRSVLYGRARLSVVSSRSISNSSPSPAISTSSISLR
jgi:hypothetical protein